MYKLLLAASLGAVLSTGAMAEPIQGGDLVAASDLEPVSMDPIFGNAPAKDGVYYNLFYDNLFYLDQAGEMQP
ncbi:MAG: hypothetical protein NXH88_16970, partial [Hyphomonas sp.]|nr:hypothetical protein [Hyphomonas sp.]